jgi:hypothetical protein
VRKHGIEVLVHDPFQTGTVARRRPGSGVTTQHQDSAEKSNSHAADLLIHPVFVHHKAHTRHDQGPLAYHPDPHAKQRYDRYGASARRARAQSEEH